MKTDLYTKIVLSVIAVFLGVLIFQNTSVISTVQASTATIAPNPLPAAAQTAPIDVNISHIGGLPINSYYGGMLPVSIQKNYDK